MDNPEYRGIVSLTFISLYMDIHCFDSVLHLSLAHITHTLLTLPLGRATYVAMSADAPPSFARKEVVDPMMSHKLISTHLCSRPSSSTPLYCHEYAPL
jgi:hypothetical protein